MKTAALKEIAQEGHEALTAAERLRDRLLKGDAPHDLIPELQQQLERGTTDRAPLTIDAWLGDAIAIKDPTAAPFRMPRARRDALASSLGAAVGRLRAACVPCGVATVPVAVFALAVLYLLRVGLWHSATGAQLLPRYDVLGRILPNANQITDYVPDVRARQFTNATRWITVCVSSLGSDVVLRCFDGVSGALVR